MRKGIIDTLIALFMIGLLGFLIYIYMYRPELWHQFVKNLASSF